MICLAQVELMLTTKPFKVYVMALLLIIEVKINFSLGFENTYYQTNKLQYVHALHCTIILYIVPKGPELSQLEDSKGRGPQWNNHVTEVVRNKYVNHQARRVDLRAILILIATSVGALLIPTIKQTATDIAHQTNKLNT